MNKKIKSLFLLTAASTASFHIWNKIAFSHATYQNLLSSQTRGNVYTYDWRFGKIHYAKTGSGEPILLLHDLTIGSSSYEFHKIVPELAKEREVYCIDLLGFGKSEKPDLTYTNYLYVQLVTDFIKNVIGRKTDVLASGDSVPVAIMACHNDKEIFHRIIAVNPQSLFYLSKIPSRRSRIRKHLLNIPVFGTYLFNLYSSEKYFRNYFLDGYYDLDKIEDRDIHAYVEASHTGGYAAKFSYSSYVGLYTNANIIHALKEINNSIFIIAGDQKEDSHGIVDNYVYYNPAIEFVYVARSKQLLLLERPEMVLRHIKTFLSVR